MVVSKVDDVDGGSVVDVYSGLMVEDVGSIGVVMVGLDDVGVEIDGGFVVCKIDSVVVVFFVVPVSVILVVDSIVVVGMIVEEVLVGIAEVVVFTGTCVVVDDTIVDGVWAVVEQSTVTQHTFIS